MWVLRESRARYAKYLVCARHKYGDHGGGPEEHKSGFLLGKISGLAPAEEDASRYLIKISEWAAIDIPDLWQWGRNPVHYANLDELDIDPDAQEWKPVKPGKRAVEAPNRKQLAVVAPTDGQLNVGQVIRDLAAKLGVSADAIEITIHARKSA